MIQKVTWTGGSVPTGEDSLFQFLAQPAQSGTYTFEVEQTYSDGSIVDWTGPESSDDPAPTIDAKSSLGGGGSSLLGIVALVLASSPSCSPAPLCSLAAAGDGGGKRPLA